MEKIPEEYVVRDKDGNITWIKAILWKHDENMKKLYENDKPLIWNKPKPWYKFW